ncbi:hypothetical protein PNK_0948 [Candidatus Protochlamydia naegleriophila]|uniref:Uncharacterized protein n=1 Tax=Candidatus Protochlamydia naegleriophila TaxID=389348 RepID=A0A0U5JBT7_9BACT|nr:hypothetical protein [Candidatus Protochlamydia naegleriophila]CUI16573.1 hypothetical protein PNK_0948 [Candidatus Protochlamydia naegleriophila]
MIESMLSRWNPLNVFGLEMEYEDLILHPLQPNETLMQDSRGCIHRLKVPSKYSSTWEIIVFWIQTHLNKSGHLDAIDKLLSNFETNTLQSSFLVSKEFKVIKAKLECLKSLKNDYAFHYLHVGNPQAIERRLKAIEQKALSIFENSVQKTAYEQEEERKKAFLQFREEIDCYLAQLAKDHPLNLQKIRVLLLASPQHLIKLFEDHIAYTRSRLQKIEAFADQVDQLKQDHQGKFTIPFLKEQLRQLRIKLRREMENISLEMNVLIDNLKISYRMATFKEVIAELLISLYVDPEGVGNVRNGLIEGNLTSQIERVKRRLTKEIEHPRL